MKFKNSKTYIPRKKIAAICTKLGKKLTRDYKNKDLVVLCVLKGSFIFTADLVRELDIPFEIDFIRVSSYDGTESTGKIKIKQNFSADIKGKDVLVVEDIVDTGLTLSLLKMHLQAFRPKSVKSCVLLDKPSRRKVKFEADYVGIKIKDLFVVGYGLDYNEQGRNLKDIIYLPS